MASSSKSTIRLQDVAREAGVTRQTAGAVLLGGKTNIRASEETARRIKAAAQRLQYQPNQAARHLKGARSRVIGVFGRYLADTTQALIIDDVTNLLAARGYMMSLSLLTDPNSIDEHLAKLILIGAVGIICADCSFLGARPDNLRRLLEYFPRTVIYGAIGAESRIQTHCVDVDRTAATRLAVRHLAERGRRRIGYFGLAEPHHMRMIGYRAELEAQGLIVNKDLIVDFPADAFTSEEEMSKDYALVAEIFERLIVKQKADALITAIGPLVTLALHQLLLARGHKMPEDLALVSIRDNPLHQALNPSVTAVKLHHDRVSLPMVTMLDQMIENDSHLHMRGIFHVEPELIVRQSS